MTGHGKNSQHPYEEAVKVSGRVLEADVRQGRCQVWLDDDTQVSVAFTKEQEPRVIAALQDHEHTHLEVHGLGEFTPEGELKSVIRADRLALRQREPRTFDQAGPRIEEVIADLVKDVPDEEWDKLPTDLSSRLDYYLYGIDRK